MLDKLVDLIATHGIMPVTIFLLSASNALLIVFLMRLKDDNYKSILQKVNEIQTDIVKHGEISKSNYSSLVNLLDRLQKDIDNLFEEIKENEKEGNIQQVKRTVEKIRDDLFELKSIFTAILTTRGGINNGKS